MLPKDYVEDWTDIHNLPLPAIHCLLSIYHDSRVRNELEDNDPRMFILYDSIKYEQCYDVLDSIED